MYKMNDGWTDERMDDFRDEVYRRFDDVDKRFDKFEADVDRRFGEVDKRFDRFEGGVDRRFDKVDHELNRINDRFDGLHKIMVYAILALGSSTVAGWATMIALLLTRT